MTWDKARIHSVDRRGTYLGHQDISARMPVLEYAFNATLEGRTGADIINTNPSACWVDFLSQAPYAATNPEALVALMANTHVVTSRRKGVAYLTSAWTLFHEAKPRPNLTHIVNFAHHDPNRYQNDAVYALVAAQTLRASGIDTETILRRLANESALRRSFSPPSL